MDWQYQLKFQVNNQAAWSKVYLTFLGPAIVEDGPNPAIETYNQFRNKGVMLLDQYNGWIDMPPGSFTICVAVLDDSGLPDKDRTAAFVAASGIPHHS